MQDAYNSKQLEIQYFFSLTEQTALNLDFKPCEEYENERIRKTANTSTLLIGNEYLTNGIERMYTDSSGNVGINTISFHPSSESAGYWKVGEGLQMHNKKKPSWLYQQMTKLFFGWKWMNNENRN